jgi:branched-chain amino acid transport system substrate-binding protein
MISATAPATQGQVTPETLSAAIHRVKYTGLLGTFEFDNTGLGLHETQIAIIKNGKLTNP